MATFGEAYRRAQRPCHAAGSPASRFETGHMPDCPAGHLALDRSGRVVSPGVGTQVRSRLPASEIVHPELTSPVTQNVFSNKMSGVRQLGTRTAPPWGAGQPPPRKPGLLWLRACCPDPPDRYARAARHRPRSRPRRGPRRRALRSRAARRCRSRGGRRPWRGTAGLRR